MLAFIDHTTCGLVLSQDLEPWSLVAYFPLSTHSTQTLHSFQGHVVTEEHNVVVALDVERNECSCVHFDFALVRHSCDPTVFSVKDGDGAWLLFTARRCCRGEPVTRAVTDTCGSYPVGVRSFVLKPHLQDRPEYDANAGCICSKCTVDRLENQQTDLIWEVNEWSQFMAQSALSLLHGGRLNHAKRALDPLDARNSKQGEHLAVVFKSLGFFWVARDKSKCKSRRRLVDGMLVAETYSALLLHTDFMFLHLQTDLAQTCSQMLSLMHALRSRGKVVPASIELEVYKACLCGLSLNLDRHPHLRRRLMAEVKRDGGMDKLQVLATAHVPLSQNEVQTNEVLTLCLEKCPMIVLGEDQLLRVIRAHELDPGRHKVWVVDKHGACSWDHLYSATRQLTEERVDLRTSFSRVCLGTQTRVRVLRQPGMPHFEKQAQCFLGPHDPRWDYLASMLPPVRQTFFMMEDQALQLTAFMKSGLSLFQTQTLLLALVSTQVVRQMTAQERANPRVHREAHSVRAAELLPEATLVTFCTRSGNAAMCGVGSVFVFGRDPAPIWRLNPWQ